MSFNWTLILVAALTIAAFIPLSLYYLNNRASKHLSPAVIFSSFWGVVAGLFLLVSIFYTNSNYDLQLQAMLSTLGGAAAGWILGMYISPIGSTEASAFQKYGTALAGLLSGYTLKTGIDFARDHRPWIHTNWLQLLLFAVAFAITVAVVYNSRAYDNKLVEVHPVDAKLTATNGVFKIAQQTQEDFFAKVLGPDNPSVTWTLSPPGTAGTNVTFLGRFTAGTAPGHYKLIATNIEDPSLSNFADIDVI